MISERKVIRSERNHLMITRQDIAERREEILALASRYGAHDLRIFGSVARGDQRDDSDLDIIARFDLGRSLFDQGGLLMDLQDLLGIKVDLISESGMRPRFRDHVMKEAVPL
jgi:predicted nucleotidyltransferase